MKSKSELLRQHFPVPSPLSSPRPSPGSARPMPLEVHKPAITLVYDIVIILGAVVNITCCNDKPADRKRTEVQMKGVILMVKWYLIEREGAKRCKLVMIHS